MKLFLISNFSLYAQQDMMVKIKVTDSAQLDSLLTAEAYEALIG